MNKNIIFAIAGFAGGLAAGVGGTLVVQRIIESKKKPVKVLLTKDLEQKKEEVKEEPKEEEEVERIELSPEDYERFKEIVTSQGYASAEDIEAVYPTDDDPYIAGLEASRKMNEQIEAYRKEHEGQIEMMKEDDWDTDFPEEDYEHEELWFFPDEYVLTDEDGVILNPIESFVGTIFDKTRFPYNNWEVIYIRNHPMQKDYKIHKETRMGREEFFY